MEICLVSAIASLQRWETLRNCNRKASRCTIMEIHQLNALPLWCSRSISRDVSTVSLFLQQERRQTEDPQRLAVSPGPGNHPAALSGHRGGQASLLQTIRCLCFWVSVPLSCLSSTRCPTLGYCKRFRKRFEKPKYVQEFNWNSTSRNQGSALINVFTDLIIDADFTTYRTKT